MANLKDLLFTQPPNITTITSASTIPVEFAVFSTSTTTVSNGGTCCLWTVPSEVTWATFEMWGGGGGGGGSCCCMQGCAGGSGAYAFTRIATAPGCQYTICAASSSAASSTNQGCSGSTSYVNGYNLSNFCAVGGQAGYTNCYAFCNCYSCSCSCTRTAVFCGALFGEYGQGGSYQSGYSCFHQAFQIAPTGAAAQSGPMLSADGCCIIGGCYGSFPGGGGFSAVVHGGGCCLGNFGNGGLVVITYG